MRARLDQNDRPGVTHLTRPEPFSGRSVGRRVVRAETMRGEVVAATDDGMALVHAPSPRTPDPC